MGWWDQVDYATGVQEFVPTIASVPPNVAIAVAEAKRAALLAARDMDSLQAARSLKLLFFIDRLLFAQPAGMRGKKAKGKSIDAVISGRLRRFWRGEWDAMWREAMVEGQCRGREKNAESEKTRQQANARRIEALLREGEESKAAACVVKGGALASGGAVLEQLRGLFPSKTQPYPDLHQIESATGPDTEALWAKLATGIAGQMCKIPRLSSPGPSGSRFEHWGVLRYLEGANQDAGEVLASLALGRGPEAAREAFLSGKLVALEKKGGGIRPVACGSTTRRLVAKALCRIFRTDIGQAVGPRQFGVGKAAGAEKMHKVLTVQAQMWDSATVLSFDAANAFNTISRTKVRERMAETIPDLARVCGWWYARATTHIYWDEVHRPHTVTAEEGVDQGCALSPALFALAVAPQVAKLEAALQQQDSRARVFAYLDDVFVVCDALETEVAANAAGVAMAELGMRLKPEKTKVWARNLSLELPAAMQQYRVARMTCLGSTLPFMPRGRVSDGGDESEISRMPILDDKPAEEHLAKLREFKLQLRGLQESGLSSTSTFVLYRTYVNGAVTHIQRANLTNRDWCMEWDAEVSDAMGWWTGGALQADQRLQAFLPARSGGLGLSAAETRRAAAFIGSWEQCLSEVAGASGLETMAGIAEAAPITMETLRQAEAVLRQQGAETQGGWGNHRIDWDRCLGRPKDKRQKVWTKEVHAALGERLMAQLGEKEQVEVRTAGGAGAGAFLTVALDDEQELPDAHFKAAIRRRLRCKPHGASTTCRHKYCGTAGNVCGHVLDAEGQHARICKVGGAIVRRHDRIRDWLAKWLAKMLNQQTATEQYVPKWDRWRANSQGVAQLERARLDVVFQGLTGPVYIDVAIVEAGVGSPHAQRLRSKNDGEAAAREEDDKRKRYPGPDLVPFVLEAGGRLGEAAEALIRSVAPKDPVERAVAIASAKRALSTLLQLGNAEVVIGAERGV